MGLMTFSEMQSQIRSMLGGRQDQDASIMRGLQFAQWRIARIFEFEELFVDDESTVSNTGDGNEVTDATITLPDTCRKVYALSIVKTTTIVPLTGIPSVDWERVIGATEIYSRGEPKNFVIRYKSVTLWRVPDADYTIRKVYTVWPTEIILNVAKDAPSTTTALSLLDHKDEMVIEYALVYVYKTIGNFEKANYHFTIYKDMLKEAGVSDNNVPTTHQAAASNKTPAYAAHTVPTFGRK